MVSSPQARKLESVPPGIDCERAVVGCQLSLASGSAAGGRVAGGRGAAAWEGAIRCRGAGPAGCGERARGTRLYGHDASLRYPQAIGLLMTDPHAWKPRVLREPYGCRPIATDPAVTVRSRAGGAQPWSLAAYRGDDARGGRCFARSRPSRMRGSSHALRMSTARFASTMASVATRNVPISNGTSSVDTARTACWPMPGQPVTDSMTTTPPRNRPRSRPAWVSTGGRALRRA